MQIAKLTISYDRGLAHNDVRDVTQDGTRIGVLTRGDTTADGKVIRGLGTHYQSAEIAALVQERDKEARRIYTEFRGRFLATPLEGVYVISQRGEAKRFIDGLEIRSDIKVYVTEFELTAPGELNTDELRAWGIKIQRQLSGISLGRSKEADASGLRALETLASCPILSKGTGNRIRELVAMVRDNRLDRVELKRNIETLPIELETSSLSPRRSPALEAA